jgi:transposase-like protein
VNFPVKHGFEEAIRLELQEVLGRKSYERSESTNNYRNGEYKRKS